MTGGRKIKTPAGDYDYKTQAVSVRLGFFGQNHAEFGKVFPILQFAFLTQTKKMRTKYRKIPASLFHLTSFLGARRFEGVQARMPVIFVGLVFRFERRRERVVKGTREVVK